MTFPETITVEDLEADPYPIYANCGGTCRSPISPPSISGS